MKHILFSKNLIVVRGLYCYLFLLLFLSLSCAKKSPTLTIGLVADPQYANKPSKGKRHYRESLWKLKEAIDSFNDHQVDFIQNLGDIIDDDWESFLQDDYGDDDLDDDVQINNGKNENNCDYCD